MESEHFFTLLLDVEGKVISSSNALGMSDSIAPHQNFVDQLDGNSRSVFLEVLELLLASPKEKKQILLTPIAMESEVAEPIWWEFSVITDAEMDILGVVGIGVGLKFLEQEMPWVSLVDLLRFGKIRLNPNLTVSDFDDKVGDWLAIGSADGYTNGANFLSEIPEKLSHLSNSDKPACLVLTDSKSGLTFSSIFLNLNQVPHLFILPRARVASWVNEVLPFSDQQLNSLAGSVWVVNRELEFIQHNSAAAATVKSWTGRSDANSFTAILRSNPEELKRLSKYFDKAFEGISADIELKINPIDAKSSFWYVGIKPVVDAAGLVNCILVHGIELSRLSKRLSNLESENKLLKELVLRPSHILRSPLSSMLGLLDLIDPNQLDIENQKYFSYLKPLAKELDEVIRTNAKRLSVLD